MHVRFGSLTSVENTGVEVSPCSTEDVPPKEQSIPALKRPRRTLKFTPEEDDCLQKGVQKHGFGQWTAILRDPNFKFQEGRTADSLKKRAGLQLTGT